MTARAAGGSSPVALLNPVNPPRGHYLDLLTPGLVALGKPGPEDLPRPAWGHVQHPGWPRVLADGGQVDNHGGRTCRPAWCGVRQRGHLPHGSDARGGIINPEHLHPLKPVGCLVEDLLGPGEDRGVGGVPGHCQGGCYP